MLKQRLFRPPSGTVSIYVAVVILTLVFSGVSFAEKTPAAVAVASAHPLATDAGLEILAQGGNAFDAAVAMTAALAVVEPYSSGLGGGGFWLLHRAHDSKQVMVDGRERAPLASHRDMYLDAGGNVIANVSIDGPLSAGIPGVPAALAHLAEHYGRLSLSKSLAPAIQLAENGFQVDSVYLRMVKFRHQALLKSEAAKEIFLHNGQVPSEKHKIHQPELAASLRVLADQGNKGFYEGPLAGQLIEGVRAAGGIWQRQDLLDYRIVERTPVSGEYKGVNITTAALPSSGGIGLVEMLNILSDYPLTDLEKLQRIHVLAEAMRRAYRDRAEYLGDPDFVKVPTAMLTDPAYAAGLRAGVHPHKATPSELLPGVAQDAGRGMDTTHFSILDKEGNRVAATLSINYPFGSGFVPPGTGILLNDEMDDFVAKPGTPNVYGLVGADANAIEPGKRMLSSMTPTFLEDGQRLAILGTPGGSRIITMVLLATLEFAQGGDAKSMVGLPRVHHQYLPDLIEFEPNAIDVETVAGLNQQGHATRELDQDYGNMQVVVWNKENGEVTSASDPRGIGKAMVR